jgi:predicted amidohydrolase
MSSSHIYSAWLNKSGVPTGFAQDAACKPSAAQAVAKGIVLDLGASTGPTQVGAMFDPLSYVVCAKTGVFPTTISGDEYAAKDTLYSMTDLASILLGLNNGSNVSPAWPPIAGPIPTPLTLDDVVRMMTTAPAAVIGDRGPAGLGTLKVGAPGDVTVIDVQSGSFQFPIWQPGGSFVTVTSPTKLVVVRAFRAGTPIN